MGFLNFECESHHPALKVKPCKESLNLQNELLCISADLDDLQKDATALLSTAEIWKVLLCSLISSYLQHAFKIS